MAGRDSSPALSDRADSVTLRCFAWLPITVRSIQRAVAGVVRRRPDVGFSELRRVCGVKRVGVSVGGASQEAFASAGRQFATLRHVRRRNAVAPASRWELEIRFHWTLGHKPIGEGWMCIYSNFFCLGRGPTNSISFEFEVHFLCISSNFITP